jgi:hypothetical protein
MKLRVAIVMFVGLAGAAASARAQSSPDTAAAPSTPPTAWSWQPSLFILASADENSDPPLDAFPVGFEEPAVAGNLGAGFDMAHRTAHSRMGGSVFGLLRSPQSGPDRAMYVGGRFDWSWQLAPSWRIDVTDGAKLQRQPQLDVAGFQRNNAALSVEWRRKAPLGVSLEVADRRRDLPALEVLGFARQSVTLGLVSSNATRAAELGIGLQRYHAPTASGERMVVSAEVARFGRTTIGSARYAFADPRADRRRPFTGDVGEQGIEFNDIDRANFLEQLAFTGNDSTVASEVFGLEPLETDSDDWDFGRRKHVMVGYLSRRLSRGAVLSGSIRFQHRDGPNLLATEGSSLAEPFRDSRLALRVTYRRPLSARFILVSQASYLRNRSNRSVINFSRQLFGLGLQIQF